MAAYVQQTRARLLRGLGQDLTPPDIGLPPLMAPPELPLTPPPPVQVPPSFYTPPAPIIPYAPQGPLAPPPELATKPTAPQPIQFVFPSQGVGPAVQIPSVSWLDQQMIAGIPNKYLAVGVIGGVLLLGMSGGKRRR